MSDSNLLITTIVSTFESALASSSKVISRAHVREWLRETELGVQGILYSHLLNSQYSKHIDPPLEFADFHPFVANYLIRCIETNPSQEWTETGYEAAWALANWFCSLNRDSTVPRPALDEIVKKIETALNNASARVKDCFVNGTMEHIFEDAAAKAHFEHWRNDGRYSSIYFEASTPSSS